MTLRDIKLDANGDIDISQQDLQLVGDLEAVEQSVKIRLQFFRGEWFSDESIGLPYFESVLIKNPNANLLSAVFRSEILGTVGIDSLASLTLSQNSATRKLAVNFVASTDFGELARTVETGQ